jgi:N-terminal acetyltransferase 2
MKKAESEITGNQEVTEHVEMVGWGVEEADERNKKEASTSPFPVSAFPRSISRTSFALTISTGLATQLALAYAIHKSFIFIRVPLTISMTPKVVRVLRGWGWDIGKRTTKEARAIKRATIQASKPPKKR